MNVGLKDDCNDDEELASADVGDCYYNKSEDGCHTSEDGCQALSAIGEASEDDWIIVTKSKRKQQRQKK